MIQVEGDAGEDRETLGKLCICLKTPMMIRQVSAGGHGKVQEG